MLRFSKQKYWTSFDNFLWVHTDLGKINLQLFIYLIPEHTYLNYYKYLFTNPYFSYSEIQCNLLKKCLSTEYLYLYISITILSFELLNPFIAHILFYFK